MQRKRDALLPGGILLWDIPRSSHRDIRKSNRIESNRIALRRGCFGNIAMLDENHAARGRGLRPFVTDPGHVYF